MDLPYLAQFKHAKQGGTWLVTSDGHEFRRQRVATGKKCHYACRMAKKYNCKVTAAVEVATNMVTRKTGEHNHDTDLAAKKVRGQENEAIQEAARNPTVLPRTVLGNLAVNVTATSPTSINHMRNQVKEVN